MEDSNPKPEVDEVYTLLSERRRRAALEFLGSNGGSAPISELASHLSEHVVGVSETERRVRLQLYHVDIPKLKATNMAEFDTEDAYVTLTRRGKWLDRVRRETDEIIKQEAA
ncbi:DUF7344 domain-containing protein [Haloarcula onubensis]|uniref:DUF7344 domain-containing protein n=1 Tax=Haloarcula onubensis TaxID=2950539 RepID=A0ABU2FP73_9EURY|nr:hypothetical protein [Halomicroarcula sp. S3CR25-11]MDS0282092.1 hypothetical protein [Halomicroarcula sp. S3CR25-11]